MSRPVICLYLVGETSDEIRARHGSYTDWFGRLFARHDVDVRPVDGYRAADLGPPLDPGAYDGIVITGSPSSLAAPEPWMERAIALVRAAYEQQTPLFGVCFGHQLIGAALGGQVVRNPRGWQISTLDIELNDAGRDDPLFDGLPARFAVNLSHQDIICERTLADDSVVEVLAGNPKSAVQAVAAGPRMRGVQFHPEFSGPVIGAYIESRRDILSDDASRRQAPHEMPDPLLALVRDSPAGEQVMHNFVDHFVVRR